MRSSKGLVMIAGALVLANCSTTQSNPIYQQTTKYKSSNPAVISQASLQTQAAVPVRYVTDLSAPISAQSAHYTQISQECLSKEANRKVIGTLAGGAIGAVAGRKLAGNNKTLGMVAGAALGGAAGYGIADKSIACSPTQIPVSQTMQTARITPAYQASNYQAGDQNVYVASTTQQTYSTPAQTNGIEENIVSLGEEGTPGFYAMQSTENFETPAQTVSIAEIIPDQNYQPYTPQTATTSPASLTSRTHTIISGDTVYSLARNSCVSVSELKRINNINDEFYIRVGGNIIIPSKNCNP